MTDHGTRTCINIYNCDQRHGDEAGNPFCIGTATSVTSTCLRWIYNMENTDKNIITSLFARDDGELWWWWWERLIFCWLVSSIRRISLLWASMVHQLDSLVLCTAIPNIHDLWHSLHVGGKKTPNSLYNNDIQECTRECVA